MLSATLRRHAFINLIFQREIWGLKRPKLAHNLITNKWWHVNLNPESDSKSIFLPPSMAFVNSIIIITIITIILTTVIITNLIIITIIRSWLLLFVSGSHYPWSFPACGWCPHPVWTSHMVGSQHVSVDWWNDLWLIGTMNGVILYELRSSKRLCQPCA